MENATSPHRLTSQKGISPGIWRLQVNVAPQPALALKVHSSVMPNSEPASRRFSFMSNEGTPYTALLVQNRQRRRTLVDLDSDTSGAELGNLFKETCESGNPTSTNNEGTEGTKETESGHHGSDGDDEAEPEESISKDLTLLEMIQLSKRQPDLGQVDLDQQDPMDYYSVTSSEPETCIHGLALGGSRRARSLSRTSTRGADIDIRSVLAFANSIPSKTKIVMGAPATPAAPAAAAPRYSLRRSVCPVCSMRWRDRTAIDNVKNSGLKRNGGARTSVIAPARLQTSIKTAYYPRPMMPAIDVAPTSGLSGNRSSKSLLSRARLRGSPADVRVCAMRRTAAANDARYIFRANEAAHRRAHMFLSTHPENIET